MTAVRCTMSVTMYIGRTTGQLVRIALRSLREWAVSSHFSNRRSRLPPRSEQTRPRPPSNK